MCVCVCVYTNRYIHTYTFTNTSKYVLKCFFLVSPSGHSPHPCLAQKAPQPPREKP